MRADLRGRGYGLRIWNAAIAHAGARVIGLDGVVAQQQNYRKSGFELAYANVRYGGTVAAPAAPRAGVVALTEIPLAAVEAYDATVFPAPRTAFLRAWIGSPGHVGRALVRDGALAGWGVIRPCRKGHKIGPLVADDRAAAEAVLSALLASVGGGEIFLDVPAINRDAVALAQDLGLAPVFETARMYTGAIPPLRLERVFGVTTFELGVAAAIPRARAVRRARAAAVSRTRTRARRLRHQITTPVTDSAATTSPMIEIRMRPGSPTIRPECSGNCACTKMSAAVPTHGSRAPIGRPSSLS